MGVGQQLPAQEQVQVAGFIAFPDDDRPGGKRFHAAGQRQDRKLGIARLGKQRAPPQGGGRLVAGRGAGRVWLDNERHVPSSGDP